MPNIASFSIILLLSCALLQFILANDEGHTNFTTIWPYPKSFSKGNSGITQICFSEVNYKIDPSDSQTNDHTKKHFSYLENAIKRRTDAILNIDNPNKNLALFPSVPESAKKGKVNIQIKVTSFSKRVADIVNLNENADNRYEAYDLIVKLDDGGNNLDVMITAPTVFGAMHAVTSFFQMTETKTALSWLFNRPYAMGCINEQLPITVSDSPRFKWRGLMIDSARHFLPVVEIKRILNTMAEDKLNTLHWHIVDAETFPIDVPSRPNFKANSIYASNFFYSRDDLKELIEYARERGIRVVPEIDMPGHTNCWGRAYPGSIANCPNHNKNVNNVALQPTLDSTYELVKDVMAYVGQVFEDPYIHIGGDELQRACWLEDEKITAFLNSQAAKDKGILTVDDLWAWFQKRLDNEILQNNQPTGAGIANRPIVSWQELVTELNSNLYIYPKSFPQASKENAFPNIVQAWKDTSILKDIVSKDYYALFSGGWYLDRQQPVPPTTHWLYGDTWEEMYAAEPFQKLAGDQTLEAKVLGGEACQWGEQVNPFAVEARMWPRLSVIAERLWSTKDVTDKTLALSRLHVHRCSSIMRIGGAEAYPIRPDFCQFDYMDQRTRVRAQEKELNEDFWNFLIRIILIVAFVVMLLIFFAFCLILFVSSLMCCFFLGIMVRVLAQKSSENYVKVN